MSFKVRWTEPGGAKAFDAATAKNAMEKYVEVLRQGFAAIEIRDDSGRKIKPDEMAQLVVLETCSGPDA